MKTNGVKPEWPRFARRRVQQQSAQRSLRQSQQEQSR